MSQNGDLIPTGNADRSWCVTRLLAVWFGSGRSPERPTRLDFCPLAMIGLSGVVTLAWIAVLAWFVVRGALRLAGAL